MFQLFFQMNLQQAPMICGNVNAIPTLLRNGWEAVDWPLESKVLGYVKFDRLPASAQQQCQYNPTPAKQMIVDVGYPDDFGMYIQVIADSSMKDVGNALVSV